MVRGKELEVQERSWYLWQVLPRNNHGKDHTSSTALALSGPICPVFSDYQIGEMTTSRTMSTPDVSRPRPKVSVAQRLDSALSPHNIREICLSRAATHLPRS